MDEFGKPEVEYLDLASRSQKDVRRFDVAMDDVLGVGCHQSVGHLDAHVEHLIDGHGVAGDGLLQALALEPFHHNEGMAVIVFDPVNRADVGMIKQRSSPGLAGESLQRLRVASEIFRDEFQRYVAPEFQVLGLINHTHTPSPELAEDAVVGYLLANHISAGRCPARVAVMLGRSTIPVNCHVRLRLQDMRTVRLPVSAPCLERRFYFPEIGFRYVPWFDARNASMVWRD